MEGPSEAANASKAVVGHNESLISVLDNSTAPTGKSRCRPATQRAAVPHCGDGINLAMLLFVCYALHVCTNARTCVGACESQLFSCACSAGTSVAVSPSAQAGSAVSEDAATLTSTVGELRRQSKWLVHCRALQCAELVVVLTVREEEDVRPTNPRPAVNLPAISSHSPHVDCFFNGKLLAHPFCCRRCRHNWRAQHPGNGRYAFVVEAWQDGLQHDFQCVSRGWQYWWWCNFDSYGCR